MANVKTSRVLAAVTVIVSLGVAAGAAPIVLTDPAAMAAGLEIHVETFEGMATGAVGSLGFGGALTSPIIPAGIHENEIVAGSDGRGAVSRGPGQFWKLRATATTFDLGSSWNAFGFWYSDLEGATLLVSLPELGFAAEIDDKNPGHNSFFALRSDEVPFTTVTVEWLTGRGDAIGIDDVTVGRAIPGTGTGALAAFALACLASGRGRRTVLGM